MLKLKSRFRRGVAAVAVAAVSVAPVLDGLGAVRGFHW